jgi:8-oxo-dGTP diphosphatase
MTSTPEAAQAPFTSIKIRTSALVFCGDDVALIRRDRPSGTLYTTIGGNVEKAEPLPDALRRELAEELRLDVDQAQGGELLWVLDQRISRPGPTAPPRKLHLVYRFHIREDVRATLADQELDELPDGTHDVGTIEWVTYRKAANLPIFPPIGQALAALPSPHAQGTDAARPAITNENYTWM